MKLFLYLFFSSIAIVSFGQMSIQDKSGNQKSIFFLDSIKIDPAITVFDPIKIVTVNVEKGYDPLTYTQERVYIVSKNPKEYHFVSLDEIKSKYVKNADEPVLFMVNNNFVQNSTSAFKIDTSYILNVEVLRGTDFEYLKESMPNLTIVRIRTKTKDNLEENNKNHIRGSIYP